MNDTFNRVPINKDIAYLENIFKESDNKSDDKDRASGDDKPLVTVSESNEDAHDLDLSLSAVVANVIADANSTTGACILESQDIWIANTGATSHVTQTHWEHSGYKVPKWTKTLRMLGGAGIVKDGKNGKVLNRGLNIM
jgi:hypothetical protein